VDSACGKRRGAVRRGRRRRALPAPGGAARPGGRGGNFLDEVWAPYQAQRFLEERVPEVLESQALLGTFELTMTREVGDAFGKQLTRLARRG